MIEIKNAITKSTVELYRHCDDLTARVAHLESLIERGGKRWCVHVDGAPELLAMPSLEHAERYAKEIGEVMGSAQVVASPWPQDIHDLNAFQVLENWLADAERTMTAQQIQIGRLRRHAFNLKRTAGPD